MAINNIKATINGDGVNNRPVGVVKIDDTVLLELSVLKAGELVDFNNQEVYISGLRSDNNLMQQESFIAINKDTVKIKLNNKFNEIQGIVRCELTAKDNEGITTTANFYFRVNDRVLGMKNLEKTGYIETLDKVKMEFIDSSEMLKLDFVQSSVGAVDTFNTESIQALDNFETQSNVVIDKVNIATTNIREEANKVISEFGTVSTTELNKIKEEAIQVNKETIANNKITIDSFKEKGLNAITEFEVNNIQAIDDFNIIATVQLEKQKEDYQELEKVIIDENIAAAFEKRLTNLESYHTPRNVNVETEDGFTILSESGLTLITE